MKKVLYYFGFILTTILLELFYINLQLNNKIDHIEKTQEQYHYAIETINHVSDQTIIGIDQSRNLKFTSLK